jgi:arylformamidase
LTKLLPLSRSLVIWQTNYPSLRVGIHYPIAECMSRIVDLTLTVSSNMRGVDFETKFTVADHGWNARVLHLYSHSGTHMDAPAHFGVEGTIDLIPLQRCLGPAWVVDLSGVEPRGLIDPALLGGIAEKARAGDGLLLKTGWSKHVTKPEHYRNQLPRVSKELAIWCVERKIRMIGVEPPSVADVNNLEELTSIHRTLLSGQVLIVEGLANLESLRDERVFFCAIPLKIERGDGSPCRAFAIEGAFPYEESGSS